MRLARESADKNLVALGQVRRVGDVNQLVVRPQEAVAAVQTLAQAYADYYAAAGDYNRAQFQLYRALGNPAQTLTAVSSAAVGSPASTGPPASNGPPDAATPEVLPLPPAEQAPGA